jgi:hypothetical protein
MFFKLCVRAPRILISLEAYNCTTPSLNFTGEISNCHV